MKITLAALTVAASLMTGGVYAYDNKTLTFLKDLSDATITDLLKGQVEGTLKERNERRELLRLAKEGWEKHSKQEIDLSSANLNDFFLYEVDLNGANLRDANLNRAGLKDSKLQLANLGGANLTQANLTGADLSGANLTSADLGYAIMDGVTLCNTTMPDGSVIYSGC